MQWLVWPGGQPTLSNTTSPHNFPLPLSQWERQVLKSLCKMILAFLLNIKSFMNEWFVVWLRPKGGGWRVGDLIKSKARRSVFQKRSEIFVIVITQVIRPVKLGWTYYIKIYLFILCLELNQEPEIPQDWVFANQTWLKFIISTETPDWGVSAESALVG